MKSNDKSKHRFCFYCGEKLKVVVTADGMEKYKCPKCGVIMVSKRAGRRNSVAEFIEPHN